MLSINRFIPFVGGVVAACEENISETGEGSTKVAGHGEVKV